MTCAQKCWTSITSKKIHHRDHLSFDFVTRMTLLVRNGQHDPKIDFYLVAESPPLKNLCQLWSFPTSIGVRKSKTLWTLLVNLGVGWLLVSSQEALDLQCFCFKGEGFRKIMSHICSQVDVVICWKFFGNKKTPKDWIISRRFRFSTGQICGCQKYDASPAWMGWWAS